MSEISIKKAAVISAASKYATILLNLVFSAVLARILTPEDYGIVAVTIVFTTFFSLFADMGIGSGVIQNKALSQEDVNSIFTFSARFAVFLALLFTAFSFPLSWFYKANVYIPIGMLLAVSLFFNALNIVPNALLLKKKQFFIVGIRAIVTCVCSGTVGIIFAALGFKYYAITIQTIFNAVFIFCWNWLSTHPKLVRKIDKESINKIRSYSSFLFGFNIINYFARNSDNLLISKVMGTAALGYYDKAYKLMLYPVHNLTHVITPVLHPILSEHQHDRKYIYTKYLEIVKILSLLGAFISPFCYFSANEIIRIIFGSRWDSAIPCFKWMALSIWSQMILASSGTIFQSIGDTKHQFISGTINALMTVLFIVAGLLERNIAAVSRNISISYNLQFVLTFFILVHISFGFQVREFFIKILPNLVIMACMFAVGYLSVFALNFMRIENVFASFFVRLSIMASFYIIALFLCGQQTVVLKLFRK